MSTLYEKLKSRSTIKESSLVSNSKFFKPKEPASTYIPALNIALSGKVDGGISSGLLQVCGPSKHFKTLFSLIMAKAYLDKYPDAMLLYYDSEFGTPISYFNTLNIDIERVFHIPFNNIEEFKFDVAQQLEKKEDKENFFIIVDSIGNSASKKEVEDALDSKSVGDMTRAKQIKSCFRIITPYLTSRDVPMVVVNHTYKTQETYSKDVVGGGTGIYYSSDNIWIVGRQQEKDGTELTGYNFIINIEKSRHVKEKSKIAITVSFEGGISKWSGLLEMALDSGHVIKPKNGWYQRVNLETGEISEKNYRRGDTDNKEFWNPILSSPSFSKYLEKEYILSSSAMMSEEDSEIEVYGKLDTE